MTTSNTQSDPIPFVDMKVVNEPYRDELREAFERVMDHCEFSGGREVTQFEGALAAYVGASHASGINSGTSALQLALLAANIGPGDEVILPANTFFATAEAVMAVNAIPVLVDCNERTANISVEACEAAITKRTAAIIAVHLYGQPAEMTRLRELATKHKLFLLEDNAQAIGGTWNGVKTGALGDAAAFSFYPGKNLGALGEGGAVTSNDADFIKRVNVLRSHGSPVKYQHDAWGWNERLHGMQAAFLSVKLEHLDEAQKQRDSIVDLYNDSLKKEENIALFDVLPEARHVWHLYVVQVDNRDAVLDTMNANGVGAAIHYPTPIHLTGASQGKLGAKGQFPVSERLADRILSLPLFAGMSTSQGERTVACLREAVNS